METGAPKPRDSIDGYSTAQPGGITPGPHAESLPGVVPSSSSASVETTALGRPRIVGVVQTNQAFPSKNQEIARRSHLVVVPTLTQPIAAPPPPLIRQNTQQMVRDLLRSPPDSLYLMKGPEPGENLGMNDMLLRQARISSSEFNVELLATLADHPLARFSNIVSGERLALWKGPGLIIDRPRNELVPKASVKATIKLYRQAMFEQTQFPAHIRKQKFTQLPVEFMALVKLETRIQMSEAEKLDFFDPLDSNLIAWNEEKIERVEKWANEVHTESMRLTIQSAISTLSPETKTQFETLLTSRDSCKIRDKKLAQIFPNLEPRVRLAIRHIIVGDQAENLRRNCEKFLGRISPKAIRDPLGYISAQTNSFSSKASAALTQLKTLKGEENKSKRQSIVDGLRSDARRLASLQLQVRMLEHVQQQIEPFRLHGRGDSFQMLQHAAFIEKEFSLDEFVSDRTYVFNNKNFIAINSFEPTTNQRSPPAPPPSSF